MDTRLSVTQELQKLATFVVEENRGEAIGGAYDMLVAADRKGTAHQLMQAFLMGNQDLLSVKTLLFSAAFKLLAE